MCRACSQDMVIPEFGSRIWKAERLENGKFREPGPFICWGLGKGREALGKDRAGFEYAEKCSFTALQTSVC